MISVIYMANTISHDWVTMAFPFDLSMLVLLLTVVALYSIQARKEHSMGGGCGRKFNNNTLSGLHDLCIGHFMHSF